PACGGFARWGGQAPSFAWTRLLNPTQTSGETMTDMHRSTLRRPGFGLATALLSAFLLSGCGGGSDDASGTEDPLIEEAPNVIPSGTGPGTTPAPPADSIPVGVDSRGPGSSIGDPEGPQGA